jgi:iron complex outermembrane receptor protein
MVTDTRVVRAAHTQPRTVGISFKAHALTAVSVVSLCAAVPLTAAHAADQPDAAAENPQPSALNEIVITGSRIQRNGFSAPTPTAVLSESDIQRTGFSNIAETVDQLPQLVGSQTPTTVPQQVSVGIGGQNVLNLRNLGAQRTLVLLDGQRVTPSGSPGSTTPGTGVVDINNLPSQLIQRVDVVTGGASAAYGSDAVAGVVNFILDKKFTGFKVDVGGGETTYGDDGEYSGDLTFGTDLFGGRGHLLLSVGGERSNGVPDLTNSVRPWYDGIRSIPNRAYISQAKTPNLPAFITYPNVNIALWAPGGLISSGPLKGTEFGPGGTPQHFQYGSIRAGTQMVGGQTNDQNSYLALAETLSRYNLFGRMSYDLTDNIEGYAQFLFGQSIASDNASQYFGTFSTNVNNPFIPAATDAQLRADGVSKFNLGVLTPGIGSLFQYNSRSVAQATFGLNGALSGDWHWQVYYKYGESRLDNQLQNNINTAAIYPAANVITGPGGSPVCASYRTNPGCIPLNLFGTGVASAQAIAAIEGASQVKTTLKEPVAEGTISGEPFNLWAGPVSLTAGGNWRQESIATPFVDPLSLANDWFSANYKPTVGSYSVDEFFAETVVPLAKDQLFAKSLDLDAAVRETDYSTSGWVSTWKVGGNYKPVDDVTFRGYRSRDIRAPNLGELYEQGSSQLQPNIVDPRYGNGTIAGFPNLQSGNVKLQPETSDQWGVGIVFRPTWLSDFSASVDYYNVTVNGEIATLPIQTLITDCLEGTVPQYCQFVKTGPTTVDGVPQNSVIQSITAPVNLQTSHQEGVDIEVDYRKPLADWISGSTATVTLRSFASYTPSSTINSGVNVNGAPVIHQSAGELATVDNPAGIPYWRTNTSVDYAQGPITLSGTWRFISAGVLDRSFYDNGGPTPVRTDLNRIPAVSYFDLGLTYGTEQRSHQVQFYVRVTNLLNRSPPVVSASNFYSTQTAPAEYDVLGRFIRAGIRFTF